MKNIGIFGGSFNPIHNGHIKLAEYFVQQGFVDEIWLMVSPHNPLKEKQGLLPEDLRFKLVEIAVANISKVKACDFEFSLPRPNYTWNTLQNLKKTYPELRFSLIIGADNWHSFPRWSHPEQILEHYSIYIYPREDYPISEELPNDVRLVNAPLSPWSSTEVRQRLQEGLSVEKMLPTSIIELLKKEIQRRNLKLF